MCQLHVKWQATACVLFSLLLYFAYEIFFQFSVCFCRFSSQTIAAGNEVVSAVK